MNAWLSEQESNLPATPPTVIGRAEVRALHCGAIADAIALTYANGRVQATRPVYAGKLLSTVMCDERRPQLISLRPRAFPKPEPDPARAGTVTPVAPALAEDAIPLKVVDYVVEQGQVSLADAKIIVSGGRGVGGPEGFAPIPAGTS